MREQLQALVDEMTDEIQMSERRPLIDSVSLRGKLRAILAASPQSVSVKPGWVCKDHGGCLTWFSAKPEWYPEHREWATPEPNGEDWTEAGCVTDPWPDKPNGGPECIMEVK